MKFFQIFWLALGAAALGCGTTGNTGNAEQVGTVKQSLNGDTSHLPIPCLWDSATAHYKRVWDGNNVELVVADADATCRGIGGFIFSGTDTRSPYVSAVHNLVVSTENAIGAVTGNYSWGDGVRGKSSCDLANDELRPYPITEYSGRAPLWKYWSLPANHAHSGQPFNELAYSSCMAQQIHAVLGAGAGLLLPQDEQLELENAERNHAQRAVQAFTAIAGIAGADDAGASDGMTMVGGIQLAVNRPTYTQYQQDMIAAAQQDFVGSLEILLESSKNLGSLMGRSRNAKDDLPGGTDKSAYGWTVPADQTWGVGSWAQRDIALQLGGDPLGILPGSTPISQYGTIFSSNMLPYVKTDSSAPQIATVLRLARQFNAVKLQTTGTGTCRQIDVTGSVTRLSQALTTALNAQACPSVITGCATHTTDPNILLNNFRITAAHVQAAVQLLSDMFGGSLGVPVSTDTSTNKLSACGSRPTQTFTGTLLADTTGLVTLSNWDFAPRGLDAFTGLAAMWTSGQSYLRYPIPDAVRITTNAANPNPNLGLEENSNGLTQSFTSNREMLAIMPTLVAARHVLADMVALRPNTTSHLMPAGSSVVKMIDAAIGPSVYMIPDDSSHTSDATGLTSLSAVADYVRLSGNAADPFWASGAVGIRLIRLPDTPLTADLVRHPEASINGVTLAKLIQDRVADAGRFSAALTYDTAISTATGVPSWDTSFPVASAVGNYTLIAVRFDDNPATAAALASSMPTRTLADLRRCVRLLGESVSNLSTDYYHGTYLASGGSIGTDLARQLTPKATNPSQPAYDGFGVPTDWVPPFSAEILGGDPGTTSATYYMAAAKDASSNASLAVQRAIQDLLDEEAQQHEADLSDNAKQEASRKAMLKAEQGLQEESVGLCGTQNPNCSIGLTTTTLQPAWYTALSGYPNTVACANYNVANDPVSDPAGANNTNPAILVSPMSAGSLSDPTSQVNAAQQDAQTAIATTKCFVRRVIDNFLGGQVQLADAVSPLLSQGSQPAFTNFSGGSLQGALIEQWQAIKAPGDQLEKIIAGLDAAQAQVEAANAVVAMQGQEVRNQCSATAMARAVAAGFSAGFLSASWSAGPLLAQQDRCTSATLALGPEVKKAAATNREAFSGITEKVQGITDSAGRIAKSGAALAQLTTQADLAVKRVATEQQIDMLNPLAPMSQGLFRQYRAYDIWRARALLENARRYAIAARRAVEARYVVDLSKLTEDEAFVKSPATWADDVYKYDLSLPSAIGLSTGVTSSNNGLYSNAVEDYVANLQSFVNGYSVQRPTATAKGDVDVLLLPGLADGTTTTEAFTVGTTTTTYYTAQSRGNWQVHCPTAAPRNGGVWTYLSGKDAAHVICDTTGAVVPDTARLYFSLDPWARVDGNLAKAPFDNRYNARWQRLAINLVGTAVRDCTQSQDPQSCYNQGFIRYNLRHQGISWVTDFNGEWHAMNVPPGVIEGGKGLAIEAWLDPLKNGWDTSYISAVARTEYSLSPFGGDYMLELQGGADTHLERIERVQLMAGMEYWVAQR